jgi:hypothetical protein
MMIDLYTKVVLTVIALALVILVGEHAVRPVAAQSGVQKVMICDDRSGQCAAVSSHTSGPGLLVYPR